MTDINTRQINHLAHNLLWCCLKNCAKISTNILTTKCFNATFYKVKAHFQAIMPITTILHGLCRFVYFYIVNNISLNGSPLRSFSESNNSPSTAGHSIPSAGSSYCNVASA